MNDKGWIKKHRSVFDWGWFSDDAVYRFFDCCIMDANLEDREFLGNIIKRGSFATSYDSMAERYKMSKNKIRRCIRCLTATGELQVKSTSKYTVITIMNFEKYQGEHIHDGYGAYPPQIRSISTTDTQLGLHLVHNQRSKEYNNSLAKEREFVSPSLDEIEEYARERHAEDIAIDFYEHYESNGWMVGNNRMRNWKASFNAWVRRKQKESSYDDDVQMNIQ